jgi:hypothetical protein
MSALAILQREFMDALFDDTQAPSGIEVYRRNVQSNLHDALAAAYPAVRRLVGEGFFREAARRYSREHPSRSADLHEYGALLAGFLASYAHASTLPYLADVARLEWACHECLHAADAASLDFAALGRVAAERHGDIRFLLHPAVRLVRSPHPVGAIRAANLSGGDGSVREEGPDHLVVARAGGEARVQSVAAREWDFLAALARGATFEEASAAYGAHDGEALTGALAGAVESGVITAFALAEARA